MAFIASFLVNCDCIIHDTKSPSNSCIAWGVLKFLTQLKQKKAVNINMATKDTKPRVDFHILNQTVNSDLYLTHIVEQTYYQKNKIFIHTASHEESKTIDDLLWIYRDTSFLPHHILEEDPVTAPILISHVHIPTHSDVLINLSTCVPLFYLKFPSIIELVFAQEELKNIGRQKYRQYQKLDCFIQTLYP